MKRVFYVLLAMLTLVGCQKSEVSEAPADAQAVSFTAGTFTRALKKTTWSVGDQVAIFAYDDEAPASTAAPLVYEIVDESGTLKAVDNCYYANEGDKFLAIYPYIMAYSYASYEAAMAENFSYDDMLKASTEAVLSDGELTANLTFDHVFACLEFTITSAIEFEQLMLDITIGEESTSLENISSETATKVVVSTFVAPHTAMPYIDWVVELDYGANYSFSGQLPASASIAGWEAGKNYQYSIEVPNND